MFSFASLLGITGGASLGSGQAIFAGVSGTSLTFRSVSAEASGGLSVGQQDDEIVLALDIDSLPVAP